MTLKSNVPLNLIGKRYGYWEVISRAPNVKGRTKWLCACSCGKKVSVYTSSLRSEYLY